MATVTLCVAVAILYLIIHLLLWLIETIGSFAIWMLDWMFGKRTHFRKVYLTVRVIVTKILLKVSFGMLSPKQIEKLTRIRKYWYK